ncbi:MAG: hypothetical protein JWQ25_2582 [Daejeonella sp.]|nr:hypothetical protein [Daejeonella sp.]
MKELILSIIAICFSDYLLAQTTLQTATDAGSTTNKVITVNAVESTGGWARYYLNGAMNSFVGADATAFGQGGNDALTYVYGNNKYHIATSNIRRLTVDGAGNVGIGTLSPAQKFVVSNNGADGFEIYLAQPLGLVGLQSFNRVSGTYSKMEFDASNFNFGIGNVGIGTTNPQSLLTLGNLVPSSSVVNKRLQINGSWVQNDGTKQLTAMSFVATSGGNADPFQDIDSEAYKNWHLASISEKGFYAIPRFSFIHRGMEALTINDGGNVGIGTTSATEKLSVKGKIRAQEIKVEMTNWSDFVFDKDYKNASLADLEKFITDNHHLPNIPSTAEVQKNGVNLGEMNAKLLQKIEELTLHLIEQNKVNDKQKAQIEDQADEIKNIKHILNNIKK